MLIFFFSSFCDKGAPLHVLGYDKYEVFKKRDQHTCNFTRLSENLKQLTHVYVTEIKNGEKYFGSNTTRIYKGN